MPPKVALQSPRVAAVKAQSAIPRTDSGRTLFTDDEQMAKRTLRKLGMSRFLHIIVYELTERAVPVLIFQMTNDDMGASSSILANISAFSNLVSFILNPILGGISDTWGRKTVLLMYPIVKAISSALLVVAPSQPTLYFNAATRLFFDITLSTTQAVVSDVVPGDGRSVANSNLNAWGGPSQFASSFVAGLLTTRSPKLALGTGAVAAVLYGISVVLMLPETCMDRKPFTFKNANPFTFISLFNPRHEYNKKSKCAVMKMAAAQGFAGCNWMP